MTRLVLAATLAVAVPAAGCTPLAVGAVVAGTGGVVGAKVLASERCTGDGCAYNHALALLAGVLGFGLLIAGGTYFAILRVE